MFRIDKTIETELVSDCQELREKEKLLFNWYGFYLV